MRYHGHFTHFPRPSMGESDASGTHTDRRLRKCPCCTSTSSTGASRRRFRCCLTPLMTPWLRRSRCRRATATSGEHPSGPEIVAWDTGLGIDRSPRQVVLHVVSRRRTRDMKERFYEVLASNLAERCGLDPADPIVPITENDDADWSFG